MVPKMAPNSYIVGIEGWKEGGWVAEPPSHGSLLTSSQHTVAAGLNNAPGSGFGLDELRSFEISKPMNALPSVKLRPL